MMVHASSVSRKLHGHDIRVATLHADDTWDTTLH